MSHQLGCRITPLSIKPLWVSRLLKDSPLLVSPITADLSRAVSWRRKTCWSLSVDLHIQLKESEEARRELCKVVWIKSVRDLTHSSPSKPILMSLPETTVNDRGSVSLPCYLLSGQRNGFSRLVTINPMWVAFTGLSSHNIRICSNETEPWNDLTKKSWAPWLSMHRNRNLVVPDSHPPCQRHSSRDKKRGKRWMNSRGIQPSV